MDIDITLLLNNVCEIKIPHKKLSYLNTFRKILAELELRSFRKCILQEKMREDRMLNLEGKCFSHKEQLLFVALLYDT